LACLRKTVTAALTLAAIAAPAVAARDAGERTGIRREFARPAITALAAPANAFPFVVENPDCGIGTYGRNARFAYSVCVYPGE
jgi:hypothetical protein